MLLGQSKSLKILKKYSLSIPRFEIINGTIKESKLKFPLVLKIDSPKIIHKSDMGLVYTNLNTVLEINRKINQISSILKRKKITEYNYLLQEMVYGTEFIVGMKRDVTFGPVLLLGLGGVLVEIIKDVSMRIAPLNKKNCLEMINELKGKKIIEGYRNSPRIDKKLIVDVLLKLSKLSLIEKNISEIDFNPVIINEKRAYVVDARIITEDKNV